MNMGSISPDFTGAKRSRLKVGPQLRFRVCVTLCFFWHDSFRSEVHHISVQLASRSIDIVDIVVVFDVLRAKILVEVLLWNITES